MNNRQLTAALRSWKTTLVAVFAAVVALLQVGIELTDGDSATVPDVEGVTVAVLAATVALIGFFARDSDKSSQDVGVR